MQTRVFLYKPTIGDYAVVGRTQAPRNRMSTILIGPRRVSRIFSDFIVGLEHLLTCTIAVLHIYRIKTYVDASVEPRRS